MYGMERKRLRMVPGFLATVLCIVFYAGIVSGAHGFAASGGISSDNALVSRAIFSDTDNLNSGITCPFRNAPAAPDSTEESTKRHYPAWDNQTDMVLTGDDGLYGGKYRMPGTAYLSAGYMPGDNRTRAGSRSPARVTNIRFIDSFLDLIFGSSTRNSPSGQVYNTSDGRGSGSGGNDPCDPPPVYANGRCIATGMSPVLCAETYCNTGEVCISGKCTGFTTGQSGGCVLDSECRLGTTCWRGSCIVGSPNCRGSISDCGNGCTVNLLKDSLNCGSCGNACPAGSGCVAGRCRPGVTECTRGKTDCGSGCTADLMTDPRNCGICGFNCSDAYGSFGMTCEAGDCECEDGLLQCPPAFHCSDPLTDNAHCGSCGNICPAGSSCTNGICTCPPGIDTNGQQYPRISCYGTCVNPTEDEKNCGKCGVTCAAEEICYKGECSESPH